MSKILLILLPILISASAQGQFPALVPESLRPPADQTLLLKAKGIGDQIYVCKSTEGSYAWTLKAPDAGLLSDVGTVLGRHLAGPTWEANDGSRVQGKVAVSVPSPDPHSISWLLLNAIEHHGEGTMQYVLSIQRLNTSGGKPPANGCDNSHEGAQARVPYMAEYYFYGTPK